MASRMLGFSIGLICLLYLQAESAEWENLDFSRKCAHFQFWSLRLEDCIRSFGIAQVVACVTDMGV